MCSKRLASVQNYAEEMRSSVDANFVIASKDSRILGAVAWPSKEGTYLTFLRVQV